MKSNRRSHMVAITNMVQKNDSPVGRIFDACIMVLIIISLLTFSFETMKGLPPIWRTILRFTEITISILFTIEYALRIITAEKKSGYIFSFYGIIDFLAIAPFYLIFLGFDLYVIRALRVLRILKLTRYSMAMATLAKAMRVAKGEVIVFLVASFVLLYLSGVGVYLFEHQVQPENFQSVFDGLWWAVASLTTVGYGDIYPVTPGGKIFTFMVLICGLLIVSAPSGIIAAALTEVRQDEDDDK